MEHRAAQEVGGAGTAPNTAQEGSTRLQPFLEKEFSESVINALPGSFFVIGQDGRIVRWNRNFELLSGYSAPEVAARNILDFVVDEHKERAGHALAKVLAEGGDEVEVDCRVKDGRAVPFYITGRRACIAGTTYVIGTGLDITEHKQVEEAYRTLVDHSLQGLIVIQDMRIVFTNQAMARISGYSTEEMTTLSAESLRNLIHPDDREMVWRHHQARLHGERLPERQEFRAIRKDGSVGWCEIHTSRVEYRGRPAIQAACIDITGWKRTQESLKELQDIITRSPAIVFLWRIAPGHWPVLFVSDNVEQSLGYTADDFLSGRVSWPGITHPDDVPRLEAEIARCLEEGRREWSQEYRLIAKSGEIRWFTDQNLALADPDGTITRIQSIVIDVTERKRMEDALCETERKYRDLYEGSRDGTVATDLTGRILHCNSVFLGMLGYGSDEIAALTYREIMPAKLRAEQDRVIREQVFARGYSDVHEEECVRKDGSVFPVEVRLHLSTDNEGRPIGIWALIRDITERKRAETQAQQHLAELTRAWHANTIGEMASGLAHELNQPLCAILNYSNGCLRLSRREWFSVDTLQTPIEQIAAQAQRAADIIKRIRGLIAKRDPRRTELDLESLVNDTIHMLQSEAGRCHVAITARFTRDLPTVKGDSVEIEQVLLNLMRNAIEAMSDVDMTRRVLTISGAPSGVQYVEVAVTDRGRGVSPELAEKIFDSFFTTKDQGLGIGLSLSRRIVESHGGRLWVESDGCSGATFRFTLPIEGAAHGEG